MRRRTAVIGLGVLGILLAGCYVRSRGYYGGYYSGGAYYTQSSYGTTGYVQPGSTGVYAQGPQTQVQVQGQVAQPTGVQVQISGEGIAGSDGTRGWRVASTAPDQDFQRFMQTIARGGCQ